MPTNRQITLAARPEGFPQESDFALVEAPVAEPGAGEVLVRARWLSLDPYMRGRMSTARSYAKATELGEVMTGQVVGEVVASEDGRFAPGDEVVGQLGWQEYAVARGGTLRKIDTRLAPPQAYLHVLGTTGLTAYFGLFDVAQPKPGDTVVVSGAAGAVGQVAGQLAKIAGCRAVGIAGGPEKVAELTELYGYDAGIDYKADDVNAALKEQLPERRRRLLRQRRRRDLRDGVPAAHRRRADRDLRPDLAVQPGGAGARAAQPRLPDRLPRAHGGLPRLRLRAPLRRGARAARPLARRRPARLPRGRDRGPRERAAARSSAC